MTETIRFPVRGMTCVACVGRITRHVRKLPGVEQVRVDLAGETATVRHDPAIAPRTALAAAVAAAGYEANVDEAVAVAPTEARGWLDRLLRR